MVNCVEIYSIGLSFMILIRNMYFHLYLINVSLNFIISNGLISCVTLRIYLRYIFNVVTISFMVSSGRFKIFKATSNGCTNIAPFSEHLRPSWCALFSILHDLNKKRSPSAQSVVNKKRSPSAQSELEFDCNHVVNEDSIFLFALSTGPWFWLCLVYHELFLKFLTLNKALLLQSWQTLYCLTLQDP